jgi:S1-C subfamily serine protease
MSLPRLFAACAFSLSACASTAPDMAEPPPVGPAPAPIETAAPRAPLPPPPPACTMFAKPGVIKRASLVAVVNAGMARWLQSVDGDRSLANHRFQGWLIKNLHPADPCYAEVDLRRGDVVQKVNGKSIEKPDQAFEVFESLRTAPALVVDYLRDGKARQLSLTITDESS